MPVGVLGVDYDKLKRYLTTEAVAEPWIRNSELPLGNIDFVMCARAPPRLMSWILSAQHSFLHKPGSWTLGWPVGRSLRTIHCETKFSSSWHPNFIRLS